MRIIIGYGNTLRGEDGFGVDVVRLLETKKLHNTKLLEVFQLTPELVLELLDAEEIVFIDAAYSQEEPYGFACSLERENGVILSHHITPQTIIRSLQILYNKEVKYEIFSMLTSHFDTIKNIRLYRDKVNTLVAFLGLD